MKKRLFPALLCFCAMHAVAQSGDVGIGTATPLARLHVTDSSVLFSAAGDVTANAGTPPVSGIGRRMMWYPGKAAFRAGYVDGSQWDAVSIGSYSSATNYSTTASGVGATAMGGSTIASGNYSVAMGSNTSAGSFASVAIGDHAVASGNTSMAAGYYATASGNLSIAMGSFVSTNGQPGAFIIGDNATSVTTTSSLFNQMTMRFSTGYRLFSNTSLTSGVTLAAGGGSWTSISDRRKKEHFQPLNKEEVLRKVAALPLTSWNYKSQDSSVRHIGPMAQDFYAAFHLDGIGADTTINTADIDGVNMAAIQAIEARTVQLQARIRSLEVENARLADIIARLDALERSVYNDHR